MSNLDKAREAWRRGDHGMAYGYVCERPRRIGNVRSGFRTGCGSCAACKRLADSMNRKESIISLEQLYEALAADVLNEDYPMEWVEEELRNAGLDPEAIAKKGLEISRRLKERKKHD